MYFGKAWRAHSDGSCNTLIAAGALWWQLQHCDGSCNTLMAAATLMAAIALWWQLQHSDGRVDRCVILWWIANQQIQLTHTHPKHALHATSIVIIMYNKNRNFHQLKFGLVIRQPQRNYKQLHNLTCVLVKALLGTCSWRITSLGPSWPKMDRVKMIM